MEHVTGRCIEPSDGGHVSVASHHTNLNRLLRLPGIGRQALHRPLQAARQGHNREQHIVLGDHEVVDHGRIGGLEV